MAVCTPEQVSKRLNELIDDYYNHPPTMKIVGRDGNAFKKFMNHMDGVDKATIHIRKSTLEI